MSELSLDREALEFLESGVSIKLSSSDADNTPSVGRCKGCRIETGRALSIRVFVSATNDADLVNDVRTGGRISVTFCKPSTHRTLQLKGRGVWVEPVLEADRKAIDMHLKLFAADIAPLGFSTEFAAAYLDSDPHDDVALVFTPIAIFKQTPGPDAGEPYSGS